MKASIIFLAAVAGLASAQFQGVPECAHACLTTAIAEIGCPITDVACQCASTPALHAKAGPCIMSACTAPGDLNLAITGGAKLCAAIAGSPSAPAKSHAPTAPAVKQPASPVDTGGIVQVPPKYIPTPGHGDGIHPVLIQTPTPTPTPTPAHIVAAGAGGRLMVGAGGAGALLLAVLAFVL